jgi:type IV pilus assembly protein PilX
MNRIMNLSYSNTHRERGAVLIISLLLLLVMTILAISISQTSTLEERMAGNSRDQEMAFQAAESGLRAGESALRAAAGTINTCANLANCKSTPMHNYSAFDLSSQSQSWWNTNGIDYGTAAQDLTYVKEDPRYVITERGEYSDSYGIGSAGGGSATYIFYEVTSHSRGGTASAEAVTQSIYAKAK